MWVAPSEIEHCLIGHRTWSSARWSAIESERADAAQGVRGAAVRDVSAADVQKFVRARLSPHKYPTDVRFVDELPKTGSGKLDRRALREMA